MIFMCSSSCFSHESTGMTLINHNKSIVFFSEYANLIELCNGSIHTENTITDNKAMTKLLRFFKHLLQIAHIIMLVTESLCLAKANTINDRSMIKLVTDDCILFIKQWFENTAVGIKGSCI